MVIDLTDEACEALRRYLDGHCSDEDHLQYMLQTSIASCGHPHYITRDEAAHLIKHIIRFVRAYDKVSGLNS